MAFDSELMKLLQEDFKDNIKVTRVSEDMRGKIIIIYGDNDTGKTSQASKFSDSVLYLPLAEGLNAVNGAMAITITSWGDLTRYSKKLTTKQYKDYLKNKEAVLCIDELEKIGSYAKEYLQNKYGVADIGKANNGFGAWGEYESIVWSWFKSLTSIGWTIIGLGHPSYDKDTDFYDLQGDWRATKPIKDAADLVVYLQPNGTDANGIPIPSTAYLRRTDFCFARCRFDKIVPCLEEFTAQGLREIFVQAIREKNKEDGVDNATFEEQFSVSDKKEIPFEEIVEGIKKYAKELESQGKIDIFYDILDQHLGEDNTFPNCSPRQKDNLLSVYYELKETLGITE